MDHNTDQELLPFTCTAPFACTGPLTGPETQTTSESSGSELSVLGAALQRVKERRARTQTAPVLPVLDAQQEHALAQVSGSLAEREHALAERERALKQREKSLAEKTKSQEAREKLLHQMQRVIEESNNERKFNQEKLDAQKVLQDAMMDALKDCEAMCLKRSVALDARQLMLETTSREQDTRSNAIQEAWNAIQKKMPRLEAFISEFAGYEERAQACAELAHLRGVGLEALEAEELRELQCVVQKTARLLEQALVRVTVRRAAESEVVAAEKNFMCPIGHDLMREPVNAADGHTYDRVNIERFFALKAGETLRSPMTNAEFTKTDLYPNHALKSMIECAVDAKVAEINAR